MKGILLAAGVGKRLKPLTETTPKPLLRIGNLPILEWTIIGLQSAGIDDLAIITGHLADTLEAYFKDGSAWGVKIRYFRQIIRDGTARAVLPAEGFLKGEPFFLGYGDILVHPDNYLHLVDSFKTPPKKSVLAGWPVEDPSACGVLVLQKNKLTDLIEKPPLEEAPSNIINAGLMVFQPDIFDHIHAVQPSPRGEYELTDAILSMANKGLVHVHMLQKFWSDIGTLEKLREAELWASTNLNV